LEEARKLKVVALDKTDTVTEGSYGLSEYLGRLSFL
jgi:cation transport ATPase